MSGSVAITHPDSPPRPFTSRPHPISRLRRAAVTPAPIAFALLLLISAGLKSHPVLLSLKTQTSGLTGQNFLSAALIAYQLALALTLLSFPPNYQLPITIQKVPITPRSLALLTLSLFCLANLYALLTGQSDCHCFGNLTVPPAATLALDALLLVAMRFTLPAPSAKSFRILNFTFCISLTLLIPSLALIASTKYANPENKPIVYLNPDEWIGRKFPLLEHLDKESQRRLSQGPITIVLIDHGCEHCVDYVNSLQRPKAGAVTAPEFLVDIAQTPAPVNKMNRLPLLPLRRDATFFCDIPLQLELRDGIVLEVRRP